MRGQRIRAYWLTRLTGPPSAKDCPDPRLFTGGDSATLITVSAGERSFRVAGKSLPVHAHWLPAYVSSTISDGSPVRNSESVDIWQTLPLILATVLLTVGLSMFLSDTINPVDVVRPVIVVFGGTIVALLVTFPVQQLAQALQTALVRGVRGGSSPLEMIRAMMKICDVSRRDGLLGVADIRSSSRQVEDVCHLIGDAAEDSVIRFRLERCIAAERTYSRMTSDVFLFTAIFAVFCGLLGSLIHFVSPGAEAASVTGVTVVPFVCGVSLAMLVCILLGRLRAAHMRELVTAEIAYRGASIILEDNNVQRLRGRLALLVPHGLRG